MLKLQVEIQMEISVEADGKFKLAAIDFQFGNLIESTIPVFHYLAQYMQDLYESRNFISSIVLFHVHPSTPFKECKRLPT